MQSFEDFVKTQSHNYPLNVIAQAYMQDWYEGRPIDGGVAYEPQLRTIVLDGSLASLATLDRFLDAVKPRLAPDMVQVSQNVAQRNLLTFIAFYAGLVFCYQAHKPAFWVSFAHLSTAFPPLLKVINDDFSYSLAVSQTPIGQEPEPFNPMAMNQSTFFPLVTVIERLYPVRNPQNSVSSPAPFFGFVTNSLLSSVENLLSQNQAINPINAPINPPSLPDQDGTDSEIITPAIITPVIATPNNPTSGENLIAPPLAISEKTNHIRFNPFRNNKLFYLSDNPFLSLKTQQLVDEALFEPFGHPFIATQPMVVSHEAASPVPQTSNFAPPADFQATLNQATSNQTISNQPPSNQPTIDVTLAEHPLSIPSQTADTPDFTPSVPEKTLAQQVRENRKKPTTSDIKQLQKNQKNLAKEQKQRQEALKKSLAEKAEQKRQIEVAEALANPRIHEGLLHQSHSMLVIAERHAQQKDSFSELETDLANPELQAMALQNNPKLALPLQSGKSLDEMYKKAKQVLDEFNSQMHAHSQQQTQTQQSQDFELSPQQQATIAQAIHIIEKTAKAGNTDAMLWLALQGFRGDRVFGITQDGETALDWVNQAAKLGDSRAEKLLSKLYYRGELVPMDADLGNHWLELSAEHGHPEAKKISQQMAMAKVLKDTQKDESNYLRYLLWGIAVLVTLAFLAVAFIKV